MKLMLIQLPHFYDGTFRPPAQYPLGIGYLASVLKNKHEVMPMDLWIDNLNVDQALKRIGKSLPDVFCVSVYSTQYPYFKELIARLKAEYPGRPIITGGPGATFSYKVFLERTAVDYCVIGEGEVTLPDLLERMDSPNDVAGIAFRDKGSVVLTEKRKQVPNLDSLPLPDRDFFDIERYIENSKREEGEYKGTRSVNIIAGRGCPYQCTFCSKTFEAVRFRSIPAIKDEIKLIKGKYGLDAVEFNDELVVVTKARILELCSALKEIGIKWGCQGRINLVDEQILRAMKDAHCMYIGYGVEAYSQEILDKMKKKIKLNTIVPVIEMTKRIGIKPIVQYMYGFPGENAGSIKSTEEFFSSIDHQYIGFTTTPLPGTELYEQAKKKGLIGDEEGYLLNLTSGYNRFLPLVNLTDFSDQEFVLNKMKLRNRVNRRYFMRHPIYAAREILKRIFLIGRRFINDPKYYANKLAGKMRVGRQMPAIEKIGGKNGHI